MNIITRQLGTTDYSDTFQMMKIFTGERTENTPDEIWITQHHPVFTQGKAGKPEHLLMTSEIPLVQSDRGGQITYHGAGQVVLYTLIDIKRLKFGVRQIVGVLENSVINALLTFNIDAIAKPEAPGVYVDGKKIASLGLRVRKGCTYHGLSLNVDMDLSPFQLINPCGYQGLRMTQVAELNNDFTIDAVERALVKEITSELGAE